VPIRSTDLADLRSAWSGPKGLMDFGLALRGPALSEKGVWRAEWSAAAELQVPVSTHYASYRPELAEYPILDLLAAAGLMRTPLQLVHALYTSKQDRARIVELGLHVSSAPLACMQHGLGFSPVREWHVDAQGRRQRRHSCQAWPHPAGHAAEDTFARSAQFCIDGSRQVLTNRT
jgi:cytosine/adenosine deaminase-related metal-dependent hydrolase